MDPCFSKNLWVPFYTFQRSVGFHGTHGTYANYTPVGYLQKMAISHVILAQNLFINVILHKYLRPKNKHLKWKYGHLLQPSRDAWFKSNRWRLDFHIVRIKWDFNSEQHLKSLPVLGKLSVISPIQFQGWTGSGRGG